MNDFWRFDGKIAHLHRGALLACVDVSKPSRGFRKIRLNGRELTGQLFALARNTESNTSDASWPLMVSDAYVRGNDLVTSYQASDEWPYSPQLYWSVDQLEKVDEVLAALSLLVSVETHLLDAWPRISVVSQFAAEELFRVDPASGTCDQVCDNIVIRPSEDMCCILHRLLEAPISYVEIMPPSDFRELSIRRDSAGQLRAEWHILADFLEKGVIRRSRLQTIFVPRANDSRLAQAFCAALKQLPLPLTA